MNAGIIEIEKTLVSFECELDQPAFLVALIYGFRGQIKVRLKKDRTGLF